MDGEGFLPSEEAGGKEDQVLEAAGDAVIEEEEKEENLGGEELSGEESEDPVESDGQAMEDCGQAVEDCEVKEDGGNGEVGEDVNEALEEDGSNAEAVEDEKREGQVLRRGGISDKVYIEEPAESIQEKVCLSSRCFQHYMKLPVIHVKD